MTGIITLTVAGTDTGPFDIYSDADGYVIPFGTNITKSVLIAGWATDAIPLGTVSIRVQSVSANCSNYVDISAIFVDPNLTLVYNDYSAMEFPEDLAFWNEYFGIDEEILWDIIQNEVPSLLAKIGEIIVQEEHEDD